jgi:V/A-type H+-transporting ATPase subunit A
MRTGSLTLVGAVSPPGGDFSEPVVQNSLRMAGGFWGLDASLAYRRHYPAVNWNVSFSLYLDWLDPWFDANAPKGWVENRKRVQALMQRDSEVQEVVQLVGPDALQDAERLILEMGRMVREVFLQQNAFSDNDAFSDLNKTGGLLETLLDFYEECRVAVENGVTLNRLMAMPVREDIARLRDIHNKDFDARRQVVVQDMKAAIAGLAVKRG